MKQATIYSTATCPYCVRAKMLLEQKGISYHEIRVDQDPQQRQQMLEKADGQRTVPQIFIGDHHIGGFDDLYQASQDGGLSKLLSSEK